MRKKEIVLSSSIRIIFYFLLKILLWHISIVGGWKLFFKWVKLHLHVKEFYGTSENAVKIQLYCAIIDYCLVAIVERKMKLDMEMYDLLRFLSVSLLDRTPLRDLLGKNQSEKNLQTVRELSLNFFSGHQ